MAVAEACEGEIISCDSVQVYRGFEIGCAKPSAQERARVPHHVIDVADWHEPFDAQIYRTLALAALDDVGARNRQPIICGGTGLYLRVLRWGLVEAPAADADLRARLLAREQKEPGVLYRELCRIDPDTAQRTEPHNLVRVVRALEIQAKTGEPASRLRSRHGFCQEAVPMRVYALCWPTEVLRRRIAERSAKMISAGLLDEVRALLDEGVSPDARPMRAVGYREAVEVVRGKMGAAGLAERISSSTWAYARRQRTWLRRERDIQMLEVRDLAKVVDIILRDRRAS
jgi:tRNA dimethylallyltransferase